MPHSLGSSDGVNNEVLPRTRIPSRLRRTLSNSSTTSDTDANSGSVTYSHEIQEAIESLTRDFKLPIKISHSEVDKPAIEEVMNIYLAEGDKWVDEAKLALVKVLPMMKTTVSSRTIPSNHNIWRQVVRRKEGWNWAYWIAFRAIYGKGVLRSRHAIISTINEMFPGTDIWTANTPVTFPSASGSVKDDIWAFTSATPPAALSKTPNSDPAVDRRKRPHYDIVTGSGKLGQDMARKAKRHSYDKSTATTSTPPANSTRPVAKQDTPAQEDDPDTSETIVDCITVAASTLITPADKTATQADVVTAHCPDFAEVDTNDASCVVAIPTTNAAKTSESLAASGQPPPAERGQCQQEQTEMKAERARMYEQIKQELMDQIAERIQPITKRIQEQAFLSEYVAKIFENILDIKSRLDHLEEVSEARARIAATYSIPAPSGGSGQNLHSAIEALGQQIDYCTRSVHELKMGKPYEDDPVLLNIKREPVQPWEAEASHGEI